MTYRARKSNLTISGLLVFNKWGLFKGLKTIARDKCQVLNNLYCTMNKNVDINLVCTACFCNVV